jgi:pimeloyl-ACP methyl ester carboxylesterase
VNTSSTTSSPVSISHGRAWTDRAAGVRLGYTVATATENPDKTVLLLHGAPQTRHAWRHVLAPLAEAGYRVIAPDYRGAGDSSKPRDGYDKWAMAGDIHHLVHTVLGVEGPVSVVGHDLGSMLTLGYALRYREDTVSVTFMEAPPAGHGLLRGTESRQNRLALRLPLQPGHRRLSHTRQGTLVCAALLR